MDRDRRATTLRDTPIGHSDAPRTATDLLPPFRVGICDDHPVFRAGIADQIAKADSRFTIAAVAAHDEAEQLVDSAGIDVLLLSLHDRPPSRSDVRARLERLGQKASVVIVGDEEDPGYVAQVVRSGAVGFVTKSASVGAILVVLQAVVSGHVVVPMRVARRIISQPLFHDTLATEERAILAGLLRGESNRQIGMRLGLSERTIRRRLEALYLRLNLAGRIEAIMYAREVLK